MPLRLLLLLLCFVWLLPLLLLLLLCFVRLLPLLLLLLLLLLLVVVYVCGNDSSRAARPAVQRCL